MANPSPALFFAAGGDDIDLRELRKQPRLVFFGNAGPLVPDIKLQAVGHPGHEEKIYGVETRLNTKNFWKTIRDESEIPNPIYA